MHRLTLFFLSTLVLTGCETNGKVPSEDTDDGPSHVADEVDASSRSRDASAPGKDASRRTPDSSSPEQSLPDSGTPDETSSVPPADAVTYYQHAKPIIDAKCVRCHVAGTVAPFALDSYELSSTWMKHALPYIRANSMPPWKFDEGCNDYQGDYSLSDDEKALLQAWVDGGTLKGDAKNEAPKLDLGDIGLTRVDETLRLPEPYLPNEHPDHYRCFPVKWTRNTSAFMTGFRAVPGNPKIVHHIEVYHVTAKDAATVQRLDDADPGPGYTCFGGPGAGEGTIGGWAPGSPGYDYPEGVGIKIDPGAVIVVQVHYNSPAGNTEPDQSKVELKVDALDSGVVAGGYSFWTNYAWSALRQMPIGAGDPAAAFTWAGDPTAQLAGGQPIFVYTGALHMHNLGHTGYMKVKHKDGREECVLRISDWDFHWQGGVRLKKPIAINPGDQVEIQCVFDNSAPNQPLGADGNKIAPKAINWGENTSDEMCLGVLLWGPQKK